MSKFDRAGFLTFILLYVSRDLEHGGVPAVIVRRQRSFSNFNEIWLCR